MMAERVAFPKGREFALRLFLLVVYLWSEDQRKNRELQAMMVA
jgi:hypothetical protein